MGGFCEAVNITTRLAIVEQHVLATERPSLEHQACRTEEVYGDRGRRARRGETG